MSIRRTSYSNHAVFCRDNNHHHQRHQDVLTKVATNNVPGHISGAGNNLVVIKEAATREVSVVP